MSTAELTARRVYQEYNLGQLSDDVKRQLMILFLTNTEEVSEVYDTSMPHVSLQALRARAEQSYNEAIKGKGKPIDELLDNITAKYPDLCK